jgi:hypothetical protein
MANFVTQRLNPDWYHGKGKKAPFFEGWYYKIVNKNGDRKFAIIPGVFIAKNPKDTHAFIQVLDGVTGQARYHAMRHFSAVDDAFDVTIGNSSFTRDHLHLAHSDSDGTIEGDLHFKGLTPYPVTLGSPGIMGWYGWLPFMECNHGIVSLDHEIEGTLSLYGETIDFTGGRGYIEKDWGTNFPKGYVWMQTNHFPDVGTVLSASIAVIPSVGRTFPGFIVAFLHKGQLYNFATYNNSKVSRLHVDDNTVEWVLYNKEHELAITAQRAEGGLLKGPEKEAMHMRVDETMKASVKVRLSALDGFRKALIFEGEGQHAGLEVVGDLSMLLRP